MIKYSEEKKAIINPDDFVSKIDNIPKVAIACYSHVLFDKIVKDYHGVEIGRLDYTDSVKIIYKIEYECHEYALFMMSVGSPAAATTIEDVHAMGCEKFIVFGNCGVLSREIDDLAIIIPNKAIREEGVSQHYLGVGEDIQVNEKYIDTFKEILKDKGYSYVEGTTWTTDAFYRETLEKVNMMRDKGAICVEMEVAALQAVCDFRGIELFTFFYAADNLDSEEWDKRSLSGSSMIDKKITIMELALALAKKM